MQRAPAAPQTTIDIAPEPGSSFVSRTSTSMVYLPGMVNVCMAAAPASTPALAPSPKLQAYEVMRAPSGEVAVAWNASAAPVSPDGGPVTVTCGSLQVESYVHNVAFGEQDQCGGQEPQAGVQELGPPGPKSPVTGSGV
jgi:hypothetical protein